MSYAYQVTHEGTGDLPMSTGANAGDGRQPSHWKDNDLTGTLIGIMDPTIPPGTHEELSPNDLRLFGLIGWDLEHDCNGNRVPDTREIQEGLASDCNGNGVPDTCDIASGLEQDANANGIPDGCEALAVDGERAFPGPVLGAVPNPARSRTAIRFLLEHEGRARLTVHDVSGRRVATLLEATLRAGEQEIGWDVRDGSGTRLPASVYFLRLETGHGVDAGRLIVLE